MNAYRFADLDRDFAASLATIPAPVDVRPDGFVEPSEDEKALARDGVDALRWSHVTGQPVNQTDED